MRCDSIAAIGISSRSGAGKLRHLGVKQLWIQAFVQARKLVMKKVGTADNLADVGAEVHRGWHETRALVNLERIEDDEELGADSL